MTRRNVIILDCSHRYYIVRFFYVLAISFTKTTFYLYLKKHHGLSYIDISKILEVFSYSVLLLELPTSAIGEFIGPRKSFLVGVFVKILAASLFLWGNTFSHFIVAEIISALAVSFISGSLNAWLMNNYSQEKLPRTFIVGKRVGIIASALGGIIGAYLGAKHLGYSWFMVLIFSTLTFFMSINILTKNKEYVWDKHTKIKQKWNKDTIVHGYRLVLQNNLLLTIVFSGFLVSFALAPLKIKWLPTLKSYFNKDMYFLGHVWLCIMFIQFIGTFGLDYLAKKARSYLRLKFIFTVFSISMLFFLIVFRHNIVCFIVFYLLIEWAKPYHRTIYLFLVYENTDSLGRITILSIGSLLSKLGGAISLFIARSLVVLYEPNFTWMFGLLLYVLIIPCYIFLIKQSEGKEKMGKSENNENNIILILVSFCFLLIISNIVILVRYTRNYKTLLQANKKILQNKNNIKKWLFER